MDDIVNGGRHRPCAVCPDLRSSGSDWQHQVLRRLLCSQEEIKQAVSAANHDLRVPLSTTRMCSQMLKQKYWTAGNDDQAAELLGYIDASEAQTQMLVDAVLQYSSLGQTATPVLAPVRMNEVLQKVMANLHAAVVESNARVELSELPIVAGDEDELVRLFQNLIANAVKYRRAGVPSVVRVFAEERSSMWRFSVHDNGQGFRAEYAARIFEPFKRLHGRDIPGSGLGLAISKRIVERHGSRIWAESKENVGSTFYVELPGENGKQRNQHGEKGVSRTGLHIGASDSAVC
jgi:two-component system, chemotaxis family, sensor kinase Cph1